MKKFFKFFLGRSITLITLCVLLLLLLIEGLTGMSIHETILFVAVLCVLMLNLLSVIWEHRFPDSLRTTAVLLMHSGLFMLLLFGCLGSLRFQKLHLRTFPEIPENIAYDEDSYVFQIPFQVTLKDFKAEFYENGQPKSYVAKVMLKSGQTEKSATLSMNHPTQFMGYGVYLESYDPASSENPKYVIFQVVCDHYWIAKYVGIVVLLAGLFLNIFSLPFSKNRLIALFVFLFGAGFSLMPFGKYWFGDQHLVPALQSFWFVPHIAIYMLSYGSLSVAFLWSLRGLLKSKKDLQSSTGFLLNLGFSLMGIGLLFGALWAKVAWGDFWSFDLKETWAAIAWFAFMGVLHFRYAYGNRKKALAIAVIAAFLLLQMCWFGVNYLPSVLQSLHRY